jgi:chemotaxis protein MotB
MADGSRPIIIKKVKKNHGGHHGGSWKVAYADFVTALMAFFLLLWLLTMVSQEKRQVLANYFKQFSVFKESGQSFIRESSQIFEKKGGEMTRGRMPGSQVSRLSADALRRKIRSAVEEKMGALESQVMVDVLRDQVKIQIVDEEGSLMFQKGSAQPTDKARQILKLVAENIKDTTNRIVVEGHTDSLPYRGDQITNWELSTSRASAARRELESHGVEPSRIARVVGYADQELLTPKEPRNPRNRRISIILLDEKVGGEVLEQGVMRTMAETSHKAATKSE